jgi:hypothetical protein
VRREFPLPVDWILNTGADTWNSGLRYIDTKEIYYTADVNDKQI